jgi:sensor domain CHASE-containing protein/nitrogen-specific signal transduction histidine kinase
MNFFAQYFILSSYGMVEKQASETNIGRVTSQLDFETEKLGNGVRDWAVWDDTYEFMDNFNIGFYTSSLEPVASYESLGINGILFYNTSRQPVVAEWYDDKQGKKARVPENLLAYFARHPEILTVTEDRVKGGIILLPEGPYLIAYHPILTSEAEGPSRGTTVFVRFYDDEQVSHLEQRLHLPVSLTPVTESNRFADPVIAELSAPGAPAIVNHPLNNTVMRTSSLIRDIENNPVLLLDVDFSRDVYTQALSTQLFITLAFLFIGICYVLLTELLFRRYMVQPLMDLDSKMIEVGNKRDLSRHLEVSGDDEIASLKTSFNKMLQDLAENQAMLAVQSEQLAEANRKANLYLDIYLDVVTYEILNATNSLDGYAELIKSRGNEKEKAYAESILQILNKNRSVIRNIETISTIYKHPPQQKRLYLASVVERVIRDQQQLSISSAGCEETVLADEKLEVVFHNIIANSVRFGGPQVEISIGARVLNDGMLEVSVTDTGPGIPDAMKPTIFDRFMENSSTRSSYGLGLHITKMLIDAYGGRIWADDRVPGHPEQGAAIRFTLKRG